MALFCEGTHGTQIICITGVNSQQNPPKLFKWKHNPSPSWVNQVNPTPTVLQHTQVWCHSDYKGKPKTQRLPVLLPSPCSSKNPNTRHHFTNLLQQADSPSPDVHLLQMTQSIAHVAVLGKQECGFSKPPSTWGRTRKCPGTLQTNYSLCWCQEEEESNHPQHLLSFCCIPGN